MLSTYPFGSKNELNLFISETKKHFKEASEHDINLLSNIFKLTFFIKLLIEKSEYEEYKEGLETIVYDSLSSMVSIFDSRERYLNLNIRSIIESVTRIILMKEVTNFDGYIKRKHYDDLKKKRPDENWKFMHQVYTDTCQYVHLSNKANINVNAKFIDILNSDSKTNRTKLIEKLQKVLSESVCLIINYFNNEIANVFHRNNSELRYILGKSLYTKYELKFNE